MIEPLIPLAFKFRNAKLWKTFFDNDVYAVQLRDGRIGYCSIMGKIGLHYALGLYIGESGWNTYLDMYESGRYGDSSIQDIYEYDCINCDFSPKSEIMPSKDNDQILSYASAHRIRTTGPDGVPEFVRFSHYHQPWFLTKQSDADAMEDVLRASLFLAEYIKSGFDFVHVRINPMICDGVEIPFLVPDGNSWTIKSTKLPSRVEKTYPAPKFEYPELVRKIIAIKSRSDFECAFNVMPTPIMDAEVPYVPVCTIFVSLKYGFVALTNIEVVTENMPDSQIRSFALKIIEQGYRPKTIYVPDTRTYELLKDFCMRTGTKLVRTDNLKMLPRIMMNLYNSL